VGPLWSFAVLCGPLRYLVIPLFSARNVPVISSTVS